MRPRAPVILAVALVCAFAVLLSAPGAARAACPSDPDACVHYSPSGAAVGTTVTLTPGTAGGELPVIQSSECAPGARVNADFIRNGVVVALSELKGTKARATFRVPSTAPGFYRVDLYCPDGNHAVTLSPGFRVLAPETSTEAVALVGDEGTRGPLSPLAPFTITFVIAFGLALVVLFRSPLTARVSAGLAIRHVPFGGPGSIASHPLFGREPSWPSPRPRSSVRSDTRLPR